MAKTLWRQTFKQNGVLLKNAGVSIYLASTSTSVRVFDANDNLHDTAPQIYTDSAGFSEFYIDPDDYSSGQLFDVLCQPDARCSTQNEVRLPSLQILQDTEGYRNYRNVFAQDAIPTVGMRENDLWFDTDDSNHPYAYDGTNWVSKRDGTIATAANTANWSQVVDDDTHKPEDDSDVTGDHTANNTTYVNDSDTQSAHYLDIYGDLHMRNGADIGFYNTVNTFVGGIYSLSSAQDIYVSAHWCPYTTESKNLGTSAKKWKQGYFGDQGIHIGTGDDIKLENTGSWNRLFITNNDFVIWDGNNGLSMIEAKRGAESSLWYNGGWKLKTSNTGVTVNGVVTEVDYVFEKGYNLLSLNELRNYIKENECLPNMTVNRGKEVDFNAFRKELIEKIEESTLYILQLHNRLKGLES